MKRREWKTPRYGRPRDTNTGESPEYQSQSQEPGNSPSKEVGAIGHLWALSLWSNYG